MAPFTDTEYMDKPAPTAIHLLAQVATFDGAGGLYSRDENGSWTRLSWCEFNCSIRRHASALESIGLNPGESVGILMPSSLNWELAHFSTLAAGGVVIGLDLHDTAERINYVIQHAEIRLLFIRYQKDLQLLTTDSLKQLIAVVSFDSYKSSLCSKPSIIPWQELEVPSNLLAREPTVTDPVTIIYTSGTTGTPRAIRYSHGQLILACEAISQLWSDEQVSRTACWLPLSNLFQRIVNVVTLHKKSEIWFVEDPRQIMQLLPEVEPQIIIGVPRFYEKLATGIRSKIDSSPILPRLLSRLAIALASYRQLRQATGKSIAKPVEKLHGLFDKLVLRKIRASMGTRLQTMVSGSAPLSKSTMEFLQTIGFSVYEAYGISENIIPVSMNYPGNIRLGSVGREVIKGSVKLSDNNEILLKNDGLFSGYYRCPEAQSRFSNDGFLYTGDYGFFEDGFLFLSGRKADIIKTSTGRRISPVAIEACIEEISYIEHAVVFGNGQKCLTALITVNLDLLETKVGAVRTVGNQSIFPDRARQKINADLARQSSWLAEYEQPRAFAVLPNGFSIAGGELTANLKLRRQFVGEKYKAIIDSLYDSLNGNPTEQFKISFIDVAET